MEGEGRMEVLKGVSEAIGEIHLSYSLIIIRTRLSAFAS